MIGLPDAFLSFSELSKGGGVMQVTQLNFEDKTTALDKITENNILDDFIILQSSASECVLVSLLAARAQKIKELKTLHPFVDEGVLLSKLVAYCSKEAHSCVEKAAMIAFTKLRILDPDENLSLRGTTLSQVRITWFCNFNAP